MATFHSYNLELKTALAQVTDVLNNIVIERFDETSGEILKRILVPCVYGSRSRLLKSVESPDQQIRLPLSTIILSSGPNRDIQRVHSLNDALLESADGEYNFLKNIAVPVELDYSYDVYTKYNDDLDQVMTNIIARFNPDVFVAWRMPSDLTKILKSQLIWQGNFSVTNPDEISETENWRFHASTTFTFKTWIFPGTKKIRDLGIGNVKPIKHINIYDPLNGQHSYSGYVPLVVNDGFWGQNCWYSVPTDLSFTEFITNVKEGRIDNAFKDHLPIISDFPETYFIIPTVTLNGQVKNMMQSEDLTALLAANNSDIHMDIYLDTGSIVRPEAFKLDDITFWKTIWQRMLDGDLQLGTVSAEVGAMSQFVADGTNKTLGIFTKGGEIEILDLPKK